MFCYKRDSISYIMTYYFFTIISFEDIGVQRVGCFRCIRPPDVTPYPARGKT
jgi:hypothetical protein